MLAEAAGIQRIFIAVGYTDLRKGIDGLAQLVGTKFNLNPFQKDVLFCSTASAATGSKVSFGREQGFSFSIKG